MLRLMDGGNQRPVVKTQQDLRGCALGVLGFHFASSVTDLPVRCRKTPGDKQLKVARGSI